MTGLPDLPEEKSGARQFTEKAIVATAGMVPFVGGALAVVMAHAFSHAYEKRLREWMEQLADVVQTLLDRVDGLELDDLANDPNFMDAVATATRAAERTSSEAKREALKNALYNIGVGAAPSVDKRAIYLRYVEELTPSHVQFMCFLDNPTRWFQEHGLPWSDIYSGA